MSAADDCNNMPRSFLVKKYFRRSDSEENEIANNIDNDVKKDFVQSDQLNLLSYPSEYLEYAASLLALSKSNWLHWDYELEKSYWFDTSMKVQETGDEAPAIEENTEKEITKEEKVEEEAERPVLTELTPVKPSDAAQYAAITNLTKSMENQNIPNFPTTTTTTSNFIFPNFISTELTTAATKAELQNADAMSSIMKLPFSESSSPQSLDTSPDSNLTWEENIEEKLNQMLGDDMEVVTRNIRQFLDNNRILIDDISLETGINKDVIQAYVEDGSMENDENKREFYRWYLLKVLRPPSENSDESYTCYKCGKIFTYKSYLERHIKYVCPDSSGRTWKCSFCGKAFQYPCYLRRHVRSHTGESPYKCDKCDRAFVRSTDLQRHIRNHTGEKPYCCKQCSRAFARSTDLKRHMRTHTGEKPYKCWQCGKSFSQSGSLQTHLHTHNKESFLPKTKKAKMQS